MSGTVNVYDSVSPANNQVKHYKEILQQYLSKEEVHDLLQKSDIKGLFQLASVWGWVAVAFAMVALWTNVFTVILAMIIIGAKQLGCAIIMHDTSHYSMFRSRKLNDVLGNWLGAWPIIHNVQQYRPYHLRHHIATGTEDDPDTNLADGYPTSRASMLRKFARDLSGLTGVKGYFAIIAMHLGFLEYNLGNYIRKLSREERGSAARKAWRNLRGPVASQLVMLGICWAFGKPLLYLLWPASMLTTYMFILRVRSMAEHSMVSDKSDLLQNTRTLKASWLERMLFAPLNVNYHLEHHLLFTVPSYNFPEMHKRLMERGLYEKANYSDSYWRIIKMAARGKPSEDQAV
jgi:fatty acid desaturase